MNYPGHVVKAGEGDAGVVKALKKRLNEALSHKTDDPLWLDPTNPNFGPQTTQVVKLFQMRNVDQTGHPLKPDGLVGSITWSVLFGEGAVPKATSAPGPFIAKVLAVAAEQERRKVREEPKNSNRGPEVSQYLKRVGLGPGYAWCCAFVYWCFDEAAKAAGRPNPMVRTAGCLDHWNRAKGQGARRLLKHQAVADPSLLTPGMVFIMDYGGGAGHTGFIESIGGGLVTTIEGNTDGSGTREGGGVYRLQRKIVSINKGFIDYSQS